MFELIIPNFLSEEICTTYAPILLTIVNKKSLEKIKAHYSITRNISF